MFSRHALWPGGAGEPSLAQGTGPGDWQGAALGDPVAGGEFEERRTGERGGLYVSTKLRVPRGRSAAVQLGRLTGGGSGGRPNFADASRVSTQRGWERESFGRLAYCESAEQQ